MLLVIIIVKCLLPSNASGEHISVHAHAIGWHLFAPLPRIIALFSTCVSVNFYPLCELDTIGSGRMDLIITYSGLPPNLTRCTSSQILLLATFHCQVLHKCILPCILPILESRGKEIHKAFGKGNALFIAHVQPCSSKCWFLRP